jgi:Flp pilus assembly CpaE family ATPase
MAFLDQLGPEHAPAPLFTQSKKRKGRVFGADLRPITNILRNPDHGFSRGSNSPTRPVATPRPMSPVAQGSREEERLPNHRTLAPKPAVRRVYTPTPPAAPVTAAQQASDTLPVTPGATPIPQVVPARRGAVLAMFSARGGVGTTTVAINTAASLAARSNEVVIVDLSLELGDVFVALDLASNTSLSAVARDVPKLDGSTLRRRLVRHSSGVWVLGQDGNVDDLDDDLATTLPALLNLLAVNFDYVIIDGVRSFSDTAIAALDFASQIHLVLGQDVMSVRRAARAVAIFQRLGYAQNKIRLAVSRASNKSLVTNYEIERALGLPVAATFRDDGKRVQTALDAGALLNQLATSKGISQDIKGFAANLEAERRQTAARAELYSDQPTSKIAEFFSRLFAGKGSR